MNIDNFKTEWENLTLKMEQNRKLNLEYFELQIKSRNRNRLDRLVRTNTFLVFLFIVEMILIVAVLLGNPFDFEYKWQFIPAGILFLAVLVAIIRSLGSLIAFKKLWANHDLSTFLKETINYFDRVKQFNEWFRISFVSAGVLTLFCFLPNLTAQRNFISVIPFLLLWVAISWGLFWFVFKSGFTGRKDRDILDQEIQDWEELRQLSMDSE